MYCGRLFHHQDGIIRRNIFHQYISINHFGFGILVIPSESSIFITLMYRLELTPKSYELILYFLVYTSLYSSDDALIG
jgi:hypothetical protein